MLVDWSAILGINQTEFDTPKWPYLMANKYAISIEKNISYGGILTLSATTIQDCTTNQNLTSCTWMAHTKLETVNSQLATGNTLQAKGNT